MNMDGSMWSIYFLPGLFTAIFAAVYLCYVWEQCEESNRFQYHLSTALILMITVSILVGFNITMFKRAETYMLLHPEHGGWRAFQFKIMKSAWFSASAFLAFLHIWARWKVSLAHAGKF